MSEHNIQYRENTAQEVVKTAASAQPIDNKKTVATKQGQTKSVRIVVFLGTCVDVPPYCLGNMSNKKLLFGHTA